MYFQWFSFDSFDWNYAPDRNTIHKMHNVMKSNGKNVHTQIENENNKKIGSYGFASNEKLYAVGIADALTIQLSLVHFSTVA